MAGRLLALSCRSIRARSIPFGAAGSHGHHEPSRLDYHKALIGNREVVGYGTNGEPYYMDRTDLPMPAIRWKESSGDIKALREKEKGDWKKLSIEEKKALYRASFRQTFAEIKAPTGEWKSVVGWGLFFSALGLWMYMGMKAFVYNPLPESFSEENQRAQLRRILDTRTNPVQGLSSMWDYEKDDWKK